MFLYSDRPRRNKWRLVKRPPGHAGRSNGLLLSAKTYHLGLRGEKQAGGKFGFPILLSTMFDKGDCSAVMDAGGLFGFCDC